MQRPTDDEKRARSLMLTSQLVAGGGAGAITKTSIAPLERIKILMQLEGMTHAADRKYTSLFQSLKTVLREEGVLSLWKGNGANVVRVVPVYALKFAFNDEFKAIVRRFRAEQSAAAVAAGGAATRTKLSFGERIAAGTMAGMFQIVVTYPLEVTRTRLTLGPGLGLQYKGILDCMRKTVRSEGLAGLYKGLGPTILSGAPYVGLQMTGYDTVKNFATQFDALSRVDEKTGKRRPILVASLLCGALAGVIAQTITYPGDTLRRRMQTNGANGAPRVYKNTMHCLRATVANEGVAGLYRGVVTNAVRAIPGAAIQFMSYEALKSVIFL
ncbi:hypothetical protein FNF27_03148 [Cafeteria roenbergensis]|nr:hypothetical protein FNF29_06855 [Cafeteria roenbergensis]KAA0162287.1 hypothetical protein FNF31_03329 [Cafeteria roenbergensis]KAA0175448.1 hypothetical protein FNF27_03148 [Cafeteria roenbergensis]|eukprot:KAA0148196.1 hypothetical protein FNF29_06855 [Cafeteria roenbergensis]